MNSGQIHEQIMKVHVVLRETCHFLTDIQHLLVAVIFRLFIIITLDMTTALAQKKSAKFFLNSMSLCSRRQSHSKSCWQFKHQLSAVFPAHQYYVKFPLTYFVHSLENALRSFACLTKGDIIAIKYNERVSDFKTVLMLTVK